MTDIRWQQRLQNYSVAFKQLRSAVELSKQRPLTDLEKQGLIQAFEFTHELAWKVMKDYITYQGATEITGSRDATREAFQRGLITHGDEWLAMIQSRNHTSHTYNEATAAEIINKVIQSYSALFEQFLKKMSSLQNK